MRYLRMLSNSAIGGALAAAYLIALVLHLNPEFPLTVGALTRLAAALGLAYGVNIAVAFYALIVLRQLLGAEVVSPGWLSVRLLAWVCTFAALGGATVMWLNIRSFAPVLPAATVDHLRIAAVAVTAAAAIFLLIAIAHIGRRGAGASAVLLAATIGLSIVVPLVARGPALAPLPATGTSGAVVGLQPSTSTSSGRAGRVFLLMLDGASLDVISPAVAEGRLPNFGRVLDGGAVLHLATLRPTQAEPVWSAVATGRLPMANGVRGSALYRVRAGTPPLSLLPDYCLTQALVRFRFLSAAPHDLRSLRAPPLWEILNRAAMPAAIIGWPLTHPVPKISGVVVSDAFHLSDAELDLDDGGQVSPSEVLPDVRRALETPPAPDPVMLVSRLTRAPTDLADADSPPNATPVADRVHLQLLPLVEQHPEARLVAVRFPGIDAVGHYFLRYANPVAFGDVSEEERRKYGRVVDQYYGFVDTIVGRFVEWLAPDDVLMIVSAFGMQPIGVGKRVLERIAGDPNVSGSHEGAPDGFLMAYGGAVSPRRPQRASVVDVTPTILYYLGLPVGRDMDGSARADIFRGEFTAMRPITFIPSYGR